MHLEFFIPDTGLMTTLGKWYESYKITDFYVEYFVESDFQKLVRGYKEHTIPLDALVIDMDWHITFYSAKHKDKVSY